MEDDSILVTKDLLMEHRTKSGSWTRHQVEALGLVWPPKHGWHNEVIDRRLTDEQFRSFVEGKAVFVRRKKAKPNGMVVKSE